jgi:hypothetical protein
MERSRRPMVAWRSHSISLRLLTATGLVALCTAGIVAAVLVAPRATMSEAPARVRGVVTALTDDSVSVKDRDGRIVTLKTEPGTLYADVVPSSLDAIKVDDFIGTASKGPEGHWTAVEIMIIPESLRAGRDGYAAWDALPDSSANDGTMTATTMTNGAVTDVSSATTVLTDTTMTNGKVDASNAGAAGRRLAVTLVGNREASIDVPPSAPIVRLIRSDRTAMSVGSIVFGKTNPGSQASLICVGKGVTPPM